MLARLKKKHLDKWLPAYLGDVARRKLFRRPRWEGPRHLLFSICDHYEPLWGKKTEAATGRERVRAWSEGYPKLAAPYRDADGRPPRHSFFYPGEEYAPEYLEPLAGLARAGLGEVEVHLHHDGDTEATLRASLRKALADFGRHGHISRTASGAERWAFIHGNWCLANSR